MDRPAQHECGTAVRQAPNRDALACDTAPPCSRSTRLPSSPVPIHAHLATPAHVRPRPPGHLHPPCHHRSPRCHVAPTRDTTHASASLTPVGPVRPHPHRCLRPRAWPPHLYVAAPARTRGGFEAGGARGGQGQWGRWIQGRWKRWGRRGSRGGGRGGGEVVGALAARGSGGGSRGEGEAEGGDGAVGRPGTVGGRGRQGGEGGTGRG